MDSFMAELDDFIKIIYSCFTKQVSKWKESDLQRVIDWADYFKKACDRMQARQSLTHRVNKHLELVSTKCGYFYDGKPLDWKLISCSHGCIFKALIENSSLPDELRNAICNEYLPSCKMTNTTDECSTELLAPLLKIHSDLSRAVHQQPRLCE